MKLADTYPIRLLCRLLGVPRSSVYYEPRPAIDEAMLKTALIDLAGEWPTYGYRRLTVMMQRLGWPVNANRVRRWMDELVLTGTIPAGVLQGATELIKQPVDPRYNAFDWETWPACEVFRAEVEAKIK